MSERQGVEVDYCPRCRGVWLDRGELDKIIERASSELEAVGRGDRGPWDDDRRDDDRFQRRESERGVPHGGKRRKRSFLSDIFEMGGDD